MKKLKLPKIGAAFEGGFFAGRFFIGDQAHALIVSPKAKGELQPMPWSNSMVMVPGAISYCDGIANTNAMAKVGSPLAKQLLDLSIGGFEDWYLPSRLESLLLFHELRAIKAFLPDGKQAFECVWYWTSTQHAEYADYAWYQNFGYGNQNHWLKSSNHRARAVRRIKI